MPLPPEVDDAISPRSPLHPPRKSFAFALRTAAVPPGRRIGTRECRNVKPLRFRDTALAALDGVCYVARSLSRFRFVANSFRQAAPKPTYAPTAFVLSSARSVLRTSIADNNTSIGTLIIRSVRCDVALTPLRL